MKKLSFLKQHSKKYCTHPVFIQLLVLFLFIATSPSVELVPLLVFKLIILSTSLLLLLSTGNRFLGLCLLSIISITYILYPSTKKTEIECKSLNFISGELSQQFFPNKSYKSISLIHVKLSCKKTKSSLDYLRITSPQGLTTKYFAQTGDKIKLSSIHTFKIEKNTISIRAKRKRKIRINNLNWEKKIFEKSELYHYNINKVRYFLTEKSQKIFESIVFGKKIYSDKELTNKISLLGLNHLFAISGLHISLMYLIVMIFLKLLLLLPIRIASNGSLLRYSEFLALLLIFLYLDLIDYPISTVRAFLMLCYWISSKHFFHWQSPWYAFLNLLILFISFSPLSIARLSFQLSFLAISIILLCLPVLEIKISSSKIVRSVFSGLVLSFFISVITFPLILKINPYINLLSPINNLLHITIVSIFIVPIGLVILCLNTVSFYFGGFLMLEWGVFTIANLITEAWIYILEWNLKISHFFVIEINEGNTAVAQIVSLFTIGLLIIFNIIKNMQELKISQD